MFSPAWLAPLLLPYCKLTTFLPAASCSSVNSTSCLSAIFGPKAGPVYSGCSCVCNQNAYDIMKTWQNIANLDDKDIMGVIRVTVISWLSVLLVEETGKNHRPIARH